MTLGQVKSKLDGKLLVVKDNIACTSLPTTAGSRMLQDYVSPIEATALIALKDAGMINIGKGNMDEFGMG